MKKVINTERKSVLYFGEFKELKEQLGYLMDVWGSNWKENLVDEIDTLEKNYEEFANVSSIDERIYYNSKRLMYRANSNNEEWIEKFIFPMMLKKSKVADKLFLKKNLTYKLVIEEK